MSNAQDDSEAVSKTAESFRCEPAQRRATRTSRGVLLGLVTLLTLACHGCRQKPASTPSPQANVDAAPLERQIDSAEGQHEPAHDRVARRETSQIEVENAETDDQPANPEANSTVSSIASSGDDEENSSPVSSEGVSAVESTERFALFATGGPLIIDVQIGINGEDHQNSLEKLVDLALAAADVDGDGEPTWMEVTTSDLFLYGQFGNLPFESDDQREQLVRLYDRNPMNGIVDRAEVPRFLTRNAGRARAFSLRSSNEFRSNNRTKSPLRRILDTDSDGSLSDAEMTAATSRMLQLDEDDDEILTPREVAQDPLARPRQLSNSRRRNQPDTAWLIHDEVKWKLVHYVLSELYSYEGDIQAADWPSTPQLFRELDVNQDGVVTPDEVSGIATVPAHIVLAVQYGEGGSDPAPTIKFTSLHADVESQIVSCYHYPQRCSLELAKAEIEFFVNEDPSLTQSQQQSESQLKMFDSDENGYLDADEFPNNRLGADAPFEAIDSNGDGMLYVEELVQYFDLRQAAFRGQVRARTADQPDTMFTALDTDGDGLLKAREIHEATSRLRRLDRNNDRHLQSHEIPGSMVVGFVRGNPQSDGFLQVVPTAVRSNPNGADTPKWFQGMDSNGDGEISSREFIGEPTLFAAFDRDADGFLTVGECDGTKE